MNKPPIRVYIAGPYTKGDVGKNVFMAMRLGTIIASMGFFPFIPHLTHFWHCTAPHSYDFWMKYDAAFLITCHGLIRLPGDSLGADQEVAMAKEMGMPVCILEDMSTLATLVPEFLQQLAKKVDDEAAKTVN